MDNSDHQLYYSDEYSDEDSESSGSRRSQESESENDNRDLAEDGAVKPPVLQMCTVHKSGAMLCKINIYFINKAYC